MSKLLYAPDPLLPASKHQALKAILLRADEEDRKRREKDERRDMAKQAEAEA